MQRLITMVILAITAPSVGAAQETTMEFVGHKLSMVLPSGYALAGQSNPAPALKIFGYSNAPRADGTRGLVQVTLIDLRAAPAGESEPALRDFAKSMVDGVRRRRAQWKETQHAVTIAGVNGIQVDWTGSGEASPESVKRTPSAMHGRLLVGIKDHVGFVLNTQDLDTYWKESGQPNEHALTTFTFRTP